MTTKPAQSSLMIDVIGTEKYLTKIDGTHKIGFSASYGFPLDWVYITSALLNAKFKCRCSSTIRRGSLRSELAVTCRRDQTPLITSTSVQQLRDSDRNSSARAGDTNGLPAQWYLRAVLREMIPSRRWRSG